MKNIQLALLAFVVSAVASQAQVIKGDYAIKNVHTGLLLRPLEASSKNETPIVAYTPVTWKCMTWDFQQVENNTYVLHNLLTGKTFQPASPDLEEGTNLEQQPINQNNIKQQWEFIPAGEQQFLIKLKGTEYYLTPSPGGQVVNSRVVLSKKRSDKMQLWTIYEQHPTM